MCAPGACAIDSQNLDDRHPVAVFRRVFTRLTPDTPMPLDERYTPDVRFEDPLHRREGLGQVRVIYEQIPVLGAVVRSIKASL